MCLFCSLTGGFNGRKNSVGETPTGATEPAVASLWRGKTVAPQKVANDWGGYHVVP